MSDVKVFIEDYEVELHGDEGINIKLNTQDINDISKVNAGYTKDFSVPSTDKNNKFFKHYYNADIKGGFDARTKKPAKIFLKGLLFISGKIRLSGTTLEGNKITGYRIQFEGDVVDVKDLLGDKKLSDLDYTDVNHDYTSDNIIKGLTGFNGGLFNQDIIYPLISPERRFLYDSSDSFDSTSDYTNLHYNAAIPENSINYNEFKTSFKST